MSDPTSPEDFQHLPTADAAEQQAAEARAAKAALWKEIAKKKQSRIGPAPVAAPEEEPAPVVAETPRTSSSEEWAELFAMDSEAAAVPTFIPKPASAAPAAKKRSVIRRSTPLVVPEEENSYVPHQEPAPQHEPEPAREIPVSHHSPEPVKAPVDSSNRADQSPTEESPAKSRDEAPSESPKPERAAKSPPAESPAPKSDETKKADGDDSAVAAHFIMTLLRQKWVQWGGASLSLSIGIHVLILGVGGFLVINQVMLDQAVDFLPGGTKQGQEASQALEHKIQQKKNPWLKKVVPMRKLAAVGSISDIVLPEEVPDLLDLPSANDMLTVSKLGGSGLGGGSGFGTGMGLGAKGGMVFQPLSMFGREIKAKRLALILDVSSSMAPYLPRVIAEIDKVARGSIVILFPGCGLDSPPKAGLEGEQVFRTNGAEFERFWRMGGMASLDDARKFKFSKSDPIQSESIYALLSKRPQTYFVHYVGTGYTWTALLSEQVRMADALYWFSDFQDHADFSQIDIVRENLMRRKQKLYIQPYMHGSSFDLVKNQLVVPTGGDVIEAVFEN